MVISLPVNSPRIIERLRPESVLLDSQSECLQNRPAGKRKTNHKSLDCVSLDCHLTNNHDIVGNPDGHQPQHYFSWFSAQLCDINSPNSFAGCDIKRF